jgi:uncharacterized protein (TIGR02147 family)
VGRTPPEYGTAGQRLARLAWVWEGTGVLRVGSLPNVFEYADYRVFLRDLYAERKARGLSHRWLAERAGLSSPSFLKAVMDGQKSLAPATAKRVASALGLSDDGSEYFRLLVLLSQTKDAGESRALRVRLGRLRKYQDVQALAGARDAYYRDWYFPAIRELATSARFRADPKWIAQTLRPKISVQAAKRALAVLERIGLLRRDESGVLSASHVQVTTELEPASEHVARFHQAMIRRAANVLTEVPRTERDISSITLCVDASGLEAFKKRLQQLRRELLDEFDAGATGVQVVQLNLQLFPVSKRFDK